MSTFTTTAPLAKILKTIIGAAGQDSTLPMLQTVHAARVGDDTLRLTTTNRFLLARIDVRGEWVDNATAEVPAEGVMFHTDAAKRLGQLFAAGKPSHAHVGTGITTHLTFDEGQARVEVVGTRAHDGVHTFDLAGDFDFPKVDGVIRSIPADADRSTGVRLNPTSLKTATTIAGLCERPHTAELYQTGDTRKPIAMHGLLGSDGDQGEILVYLMTVRTPEGAGIDPAAIAERMTGER